MSLFKFAESRDARYIEELKNSSLPVYVYGNGIMADYIRKKLSRNKISVRNFVIDDKYFKDQEHCIKKSELEKLDESYNLVIAIERLNDKSPDEIRADFSNCQGIYQFTSVLEEFGIVEPITKEFYEQHSERIDAVYHSLHDDFSKESFDKHLHARIEENVTRLKSYVIKPQYFFENEYWQFKDGEILIDAGAFDGDTIRDFIDIMSIRGGWKIYSFEPDFKNFEKLKSNPLCQQFQDKIEIVNAGLGFKNHLAKFNSDGAMTSKISDTGENTVQIFSIDEFLHGRPVSIIKMDIEGAEMDALHGAVKSIKKYLPMLFITVEHKAADIFEIFEYIKSLSDEYIFFFRNHSSLLAVDAVLYAIPKYRLIESNSI